MDEHQPEWDDPNECADAMEDAAMADDSEMTDPMLEPLLATEKEVLDCWSPRWRRARGLGIGVAKWLALSLLGFACAGAAAATRAAARSAAATAAPSSVIFCISIAVSLGVAA
jgi:hypothetical protein